jgi:hypothetical protein
VRAADRRLLRAVQQVFLPAVPDPAGDDGPQVRLRGVRSFGTDLLTIRIELTD